MKNLYEGTRSQGGPPSEPDLPTSVALGYYHVVRYGTFKECFGDGGGGLWQDGVRADRGGHSPISG